MTLLNSQPTSSLWELSAPPDGEATSEGRSSSVSLIVPTLNEAANLPWLLERIPDTVDELIIVDGRSTDGTVEVARELRPEAVIVHEPRPGKGAALRAGFNAASGDVIVMIDADGSMDPSEISQFVAHVEAGYDVVKGSRYMKGGGSSDITFIRHLGNRSLRGLVNGLYREQYTDLCYGFFAFRRNRLPELALSSDGFEIETEIVVRSSLSGLRVTEVPSFESPRRHGRSNLRSIRDGLRVLHTLLVHRFAKAAPEASGDAVIIDLTDRSLIDLTDGAEVIDLTRSVSEAQTGA